MRIEMLEIVTRERHSMSMGRGEMQVGLPRRAEGAWHWMGFVCASLVCKCAIGS